jgi:hypothetical protein
VDQDNNPRTLKSDLDVYLNELTGEEVYSSRTREK